MTYSPLKQIDRAPATRYSSRMGSWNRRLRNLSPWAYAGIWATVMAFGTTVGRVLGGWSAGDGRLLEALLIGGASGLLLLPVLRLIAPAALRATRQHELWREEPRRQPSRQS